MIEEGTILQDRYLVAKQIGAGGMGTVYVGTDQRFGSTVAIKETFFSDENLTKAFEREARLLNSLRHPALPRVSDHFIDGNGQFLVMEFIPGEDLSEMLVKQGTAFSIPEVMAWADQLLDALDYLHTQEMPVVHRDIKPQNLKLTARGQIILLDFGLAKGNPTDSNHQTNTKSVFGFSRVYAPLEQIQGTGTDPRSDLYSLAATIYHLMTGVPPEDALTRATAVLNGNPDPLSPAHSIRADIPVPVSEVLTKAMALNANFRPSSAAAMRSILADAKNNISPNLAEQETVVTASGPAGIFDQKTQVVGGDLTATTPEANVLLTEQNKNPVWSGGINVQIPATDPTNVRPFSGPVEKKRGLGLKILGAATAAILLLAGCAAAIYIYQPDLFPQSAAPINSITTEKENLQPQRGDQIGSAGQSSQADPSHSETAKTGESKNPRENDPNEPAGKTQSQSQVSVQTEIQASDDPNSNPEDVSRLANEIREAQKAGDQATADAKRAEMQRTIQKLVRRKLKNANVSNKKIEKEMEDAFSEGMDVPEYVPPPGKPRTPPRRRVIINNPRKP